MARGQDEAEFVAFAAATAPALHRAAWLLTGDEHLAQDLVQATLLKLFVGWGRRRDWSSPRAYAQRTLFTTFCSWRGRRWRGEEPTAELPDVASDEHPAAADLDLRAALRRLPRRQRAVVIARFYEDLSVEATAVLLGCSPGTVKSQTSKALRRLRAVLADSMLVGEDS